MYVCTFICYVCMYVCMRACMCTRVCAHACVVRNQHYWSVYKHAHIVYTIFVLNICFGLYNYENKCYCFLHPGFLFYRTPRRNIAGSHVRKDQFPTVAR